MPKHEWNMRIFCGRVGDLDPTIVAFVKRERRWPDMEPEEVVTMKVQECQNTPVGLFRAGPQPVWLCADCALQAGFLVETADIFCLSCGQRLLMDTTRHDTLFLCCPACTRPVHEDLRALIASMG